MISRKKGQSTPRPADVAPVWIVAEAGVNHGGSLERAEALVAAASEAGADAVKFQTFRAASLATARAPKAAYQKLATGSDASQREMLSQLELGEDVHRRLAVACAERGIEFLSSPFDLESVTLLVDRIGVRRLKLASGELVNGPLLLKAARSGLPLIVSTGMSTLAEVEQALGVIAFGLLGHADPPGREAFRTAYRSPEGRRALKDAVTLLHCTSEYPAPVEEVNLRAMDTLAERFELPVGFSDHTKGIHIAIAAAARGARVLEKHLTLDRGLRGPDHAASLEPAELAELVRAVRDVERALGSAEKQPTASEHATRRVARGSLVAAQRIEEGEPFTAKNVTVKRPGDGTSPMDYWDLLGRPARRAYEPDEPIEP